MMGLTPVRKERKAFENTDFNFDKFNFELDAFSEYLKITNLSIDEKLRTYTDQYKSFDTAASEYFDNAEMYIKTKTLQLYYSSIIISLYSFLEQTMQDLCIITEKKQALKIDDISGTGIFKFKTYLEKVVSIDFTKINNEWNEISKYNHLRNLFVHTSNSIMDESITNKRKNSIQEIKGLEFKKNSEYIVIEFKNDNPIKNFIKIINDFMSKIYYEDF
jgi:hypothetical protein